MSINCKPVQYLSEALVVMQIFTVFAQSFMKVVVLLNFILLVSYVVGHHELSEVNPVCCVSNKVVFILDAALIN